MISRMKSGISTLSLSRIIPNLIIILIFVGITSSCSKDNIQIDPDNFLIGVWNYSEFNNNDNIYIRSDEFIENNCYKFNKDGTMSERKNSGWCGTPPITYTDYEGTWNIINDTLIQINVGYWGGTTSYKLDIQSVDSNVLKVSYVPEDN